MKRFTFDVKMFATVYVLANNEEQARQRVRAFAGWDEVDYDDNTTIQVGPVSPDGDADLVEEEEVNG